MRTKGTRQGNGSGWGGPAKGSGSTAEQAPEFHLGNTAAAGDHDMLTNAQRAAALKAHLYRLATTAEREDTQVRAAEAWLNRHEGLPVARNVNLNVDDLSHLDDDALQRRREELERALGADAHGGAPPPSEEGLDLLVH